jgi:hypothetical protein
MKNAEQCQYFAGSYRPMSSFGKAGFSFSEYDGAAIRPAPSAVRRAPKKFSLYVKVNSARAAAPHFDRPS